MEARNGGIAHLASGSHAWRMGGNSSRRSQRALRGGRLSYHADGLRPGHKLVALSFQRSWGLDE